MFVVDRWIEHGAHDHHQQLDEATSDTHREVTIAPWYAGNVPETRSHRLYFAATPTNPINGLYSFFPCLPMDEAPQGFARPTITLSDHITSHLTQGKKLTAIADDEQARELWAEVASQVEDQGLALGVEAKLPERAEPIEMAAGPIGSC